MRTRCLWLLLCLGPTSTFAAGIVIPTLIKGTPVDPAAWNQVVYLPNGTRSCTGTVVGPRAVLTAAHCFLDGTNLTFSANGKSYTGTIARFPGFPGKDIDLSVVVTKDDITGVNPFKIGGTAELNKQLTLLGYGSDQASGPAPSTPVLRSGATQTVSYSGSYKVVSSTAGGAVMAFGDDGGPALIGDAGSYLLVGVNSIGNLTDKNFSTRLDIAESKTFLDEVAQKNGITICGIRGDCTGAPMPGAPSCNLTANPSSVIVNQSLSLVLRSQNAVSADIDGTPVNVPNGEKPLTARNSGTFTSTATVRSASGQSATCTATYTVSSPPIGDLACTITAVPNVANIGESVSLELSAIGGATSATIDGNAVSVPVGKLNITRDSRGDYSAKGVVMGPSGSATCFGDYSIQEGSTPPPVPAFALIPSQCGSNTFPESGVKSACLALVKKDSSWKEITVSEAILVTNTDNTQEALLVAAKNSAAGGAAGEVQEDWALYSGGFVKNSTVLDTRKAAVSKNTSSGATLRMKGRSSKNRYFIVEKLQSSNLAAFLPSLNVSTGERVTRFSWF